MTTAQIPHSWITRVVWKASHAITFFVVFFVLQLLHDICLQIETACCSHSFPLHRFSSRLLGWLRNSRQASPRTFFSSNKATGPPVEPSLVKNTFQKIPQSSRVYSSKLVQGMRRSHFPVPGIKVNNINTYVLKTGDLKCKSTIFHQYCSHSLQHIWLSMPAGVSPGQLWHGNATWGNNRQLWYF